MNKQMKAAVGFAGLVQSILATIMLATMLLPVPESWSPLLISLLAPLSMGFALQPDFRLPGIESDLAMAIHVAIAFVCNFMAYVAVFYGFQMIRPAARRRYGRI
ncbi:MAG: hypothetical protein ACKV2V_08575 [Blastocatellia bacterium]